MSSPFDWIIVEMQDENGPRVVDSAALRNAPYAFSPASDVHYDYSDADNEYGSRSGNASFDTEYTEASSDDGRSTYGNDTDSTDSSDYSRCNTGSSCDRDKKRADDAEDDEEELPNDQSDRATTASSDQDNDSDLDDFYDSFDTTSAPQKETISVKEKATKSKTPVKPETSGPSNTDGAVSVAQIVMKHRELLSKNPIHLLHLAQRAKQREEVSRDSAEHVVPASICKSDGALHELTKRQYMVDTQQPQMTSNELELVQRTTHGSMALCKDMFQAKTDVLGDTMEVHFNAVEAIFDGEAPFFSGIPTPECSTRFDFTPVVNGNDFTPVARDTNEDTVMRSSEMSSARAASGRHNGQTKQDSEVRTTHCQQEITRHFTTRLQPQQLDIHKKDGVKSEARCIQVVDNRTPRPKTDQKPATHVKVLSQLQAGHDQTVKQQTQPLRSIAEYQGGKLSVSILGDHRCLTSNDPANVQITFVHRKPILPQPNQDRNRRMETAQGVDTTEVSPSKVYAFKGLLPPIRNKVKKKAPLPPKPEVPSTDEAKGQAKSYNFQNIPAKKKSVFSRKVVLPPVRTKVVTSNGRSLTIKTVKPLAVNRAPKVAPKKTPDDGGRPNADIVNCRAQWPPFNTHINPEASKRHQKLLSGLRII